MNYFRLRPAAASIAFCLGLILVSRYLQYLVRGQNAINISTWNSKYVSKECSLSNDSLLRQAEGAGQNVLFLILDAYPSSYMFYQGTRRSSALHNFLEDSDEEHGRYATVSYTGYTTLPYTPYALSFVIGGIARPNSRCTYPLFGNNYDPYFLNVSRYFSSPTKAIKTCHFIPMVGPLSQLRELFLSTKGDELSCSILTQRYRSSLFREINESASMARSLRKVFIHHEDYFHHNLAINRNIKEWKKIDSKYATAVKEIVTLNLRYQLFGSIIILSDHGSRTGKYGLTLEELKSGKKPKYRSLADDDFYSYFVYIIKFPIPLHPSPNNSLGRLEIRKPSLTSSKLRFEVRKQDLSPFEL